MRSLEPFAARCAGRAFSPDAAHKGLLAVGDGQCQLSSHQWRQYPLWAACCCMCGTPLDFLSMEVRCITPGSAQSRAIGVSRLVDRGCLVESQHRCPYRRPVRSTGAATTTAGYGASCATVTVWPAIVSVALRAAPVLALAINITVPEPVAPAPLVTVRNVALLTAVHAHVSTVVTTTEPDPPLGGIVTFKVDNV